MLQFVDGKFFDTVALKRAEMCRRLMPNGHGGRRQIMLPRLRRRHRLADALALLCRRAPTRPAIAPRVVATSSPRPREHHAAPRGRDGAERDDGSGDDGGDGRGSDPPPPSSALSPLAVLVARAEARLARLRELMPDTVSLERAAYEIAAAHRAERSIADATLAAAKHLMRTKDAEQLQAWLARRSAPERAAILQQLEQRKVRR
jgi:hypothetical protein